ncbi:hypothetical protein, partial [Devosia neptuniae]|uniref:hypothetical protein n=2 Tax=Devosia TaxID=46913 RepID=UPI0022AFAD7B
AASVPRRSKPPRREAGKCLPNRGQSTQGLSLSHDAEQVRQELKNGATDPARPLENLFALYELRLVGAHTSTNPTLELENRLSRFGIEPGDYAGGFGTTMDRIYDLLADELGAVAGTLDSAS